MSTETPPGIPPEIDDQLVAYFAWLAEGIGADLRPNELLPSGPGGPAPVVVDLEPERHHGQPGQPGQPGRRTGLRVVVVATLTAAAIIGVLVVAGRSNNSPTSPPATVSLLDGTVTAPATAGTGPVTPPSVVTPPSAVVATTPTSVAANVAATSTTALPRPVIDTLAIGESVMQGAQNELPQYGVEVDAQESIQGRGVVDLLRTTRQQYDITNAVVIQSGTNGPVTQAQYDEMADLVADLPHAYFITIKAPLAWVPGNNALIEALPATHPNVTVIDWATLGEQLSPDDLSESDGGIHLNSATAVRFYSNMILAAIGKPLIPDG